MILVQSVNSNFNFVAFEVNFRMYGNKNDTYKPAPTTSHLNVVVQFPFLPRRGSKVFIPECVIMKVPRVCHPRAILSRTTFLIFYPCCPLRGHIWTAFLNPNDRTPPLTVPTTFFSLFSHPKPPLYLSCPPLLPILMLLPISGDIHPNPAL